MSYRMYLKKNDPNYPIPKVGDLFVVVGIYISTDDLLRPKVDVQLKPVERNEKDNANSEQK